MDRSELLQQLLKSTKLGEFKNHILLEEAFTHRSYSRKHNERLEFLGDAVLELVITELLFARYPRRNEGELTSFRSAIVRTESLAEEAQKLGLGSLILMSNGEEATGGRERLYILADVFEAFIGAIYLEKGYSIVSKFISEFLFYKADKIVKERKDIDAKSKLQEYVQEAFKETPYYKVVSEIGPDHDKTFTVIAVIGAKEYASGEGKSKQQAEQDSAQKTLDMIQISETEKK